MVYPFSKLFIKQLTVASLFIFLFCQFANAQITEPTNSIDTLKPHFGISEKKWSKMNKHWLKHYNWVTLELKDGTRFEGQFLGINDSNVYFWKGSDDIIDPFEAKQRLEVYANSSIKNIICHQKLFGNTEKYKKKRNRSFLITSGVVFIFSTMVSLSAELPELILPVTALLILPANLLTTVPIMIFNKKVCIDTIHHSIPFPLDSSAVMSSRYKKTILFQNHIPNFLTNPQERNTINQQTNVTNFSSMINASSNYKKLFSDTKYSLTLKTGSAFKKFIERSFFAEGPFFGFELLFYQKGNFSFGYSMDRELFRALSDWEVSITNYRNKAIVLFSLSKANGSFPLRNDLMLGGAISLSSIKYYYNGYSSPKKVSPGFSLMAKGIHYFNKNFSLQLMAEGNRMSAIRIPDTTKTNMYGTKKYEGFNLGYSSFQITVGLGFHL